MLQLLALGALFALLYWLYYPRRRTPPLTLSPADSLRLYNRGLLPVIAYPHVDEESGNGIKRMYIAEYERGVELTMVLYLRCDSNPGLSTGLRLTRLRSLRAQLGRGPAVAAAGALLRPAALPDVRPLGGHRDDLHLHRWQGPSAHRGLLPGHVQWDGHVVRQGAAAPHEGNTVQELSLIHI